VIYLATAHAGRVRGQVIQTKGPFTTHDLAGSPLSTKAHASPLLAGERNRGPTSRAVAAVMAEFMPDGKASIAEIARALGLSVRSLQRRLADENEVFSDLLNSSRRELAVRYLGTPGNSITEIGQMLGYSQHSSFTRWFIAEFGIPPSQWRSNTEAGVAFGADT
jgi:AraC-like DNA-binding protein